MGNTYMAKHEEISSFVLALYGHFDIQCVHQICQVHFKNKQTASTLLQKSAGFQDFKIQLQIENA